MDYPSVEIIESLLRDQEYCGVAASDAEINAGKILLFSAYVGEDSEQLAIATGLSLEDVRRISSNLQKANVFGKEVNHSKEYLGNDLSGLALILDIQCAGGHLQRSTPKDNGEPTWKCTEEGLDYVEQELLPKSESARKLMDELDDFHGFPKGTLRKKISDRKK